MSDKKVSKKKTTLKKGEKEAELNEVEVTVEVPEIEEEVPEVLEEANAVEIEVDEDSLGVTEADAPEKSVKIRMRVSHKCTIAMERYDLEEGKTYVVPENVKRILNNAGLLAPL